MKSAMKPSYYIRVWAPFDEAWWRESAGNARPRRPRIDHFLAHVLTTETGERTTVRELYAEYRSWSMPKRKPRFNDVKDELAVIKKYVPAYKTLEGKSYKSEIDDSIEWLGERFRLWQNTTAYPIAFRIANGKVDQRTCKKIAELIDSYLTRRAICGLTQRNLNKFFPRLAKLFLKKDVSIETLNNFFDAQTKDSTRFPNDDEFSKSICEKPVYRRIRTQILSDILWQFEIKFRSSKSEAISRPNNLWIEHVMPISWEANWDILDESGEKVESDDDKFYRLQNQRNTIIHTLGNLTLTTAELNISLKNSSFCVKKEKLIEYSNLTLNSRIAKEDNWYETEIGKRSKQLAEWACKIWPSPNVKQ